MENSSLRWSESMGAGQGLNADGTAVAGSGRFGSLKLRQ
ncbi:hypothetical protein R2A130_3587 [Ahrensia sp. R2A130]|nr:hypothetical protein R2A130_3587 [Ahrensia sp. R2A130]